jgi:drug/metabolite transporter (DMT)-like permease
MSTDSLARRTAALIVLTVLCNSIGNLFLSLGMKDVGEVRAFSAGVLVATAGRVATNGAIWLGITTLVLFFAAHMLLLSWADYSYVQPAAAGGYAATPLLGAIFGGEHVGAIRWGGVLLICLGVVLVVRTPMRTTPSGP